jgi:hypothetical protein
MLDQQQMSMFFGRSLAVLAVLLLVTRVMAAEEAEDLRTGEEAILAVLEEKTSFEFVDEPFGGVVEFFKKRHHVEIQLDVRALDDVNLGTDAPVTRRMQNVKLRSALNLILGDLDLTWIITDEVLLITTPEEAEECTYTKVYDVTDLVKVVDRKGNASSDFDSLLNVITGSVQPEAWSCRGSEISFLECREARVLIVSQWREMHEEIARLLDDLKTTADKYGDDVFPITEPMWGGNIELR